jgi:hypothetical protein
VRALPVLTLPPPPPACTLEGPYKSTLHKNRLWSGKRACVWEVCLRAHCPTPSPSALALALALSSRRVPEVALTLFLTTIGLLYIAHVTMSDYQEEHFHQQCDPILQDAALQGSLVRGHLQGCGST